MPLGRHVVRRHEDALPLLRHRVEVDVPRLGDLLHELIRVPTFALGDRHEVLIHIRHEDGCLVAHERHGEERLDPRGAAGNDRDRAGGRHGGQVAVTQFPHWADPLAARIAGAGGVRSPDRPLPLRERAALLRQLFRRDLRLFVDELHHLAAERDAFIGVVRDAEPHEQVGPAHDPEADAADPLRQIVDLGERVLVRVDDVVEEVSGEMHDRPEAIPIHRPVLDEQADVDRAEIAHVVREQRLLAAGVRGLVAPEVRHGVVVVGAIDEEHARLARLPGAVHDLLEHIAGVELADDLAGAGVDQVVGLPGLERDHEGVRDRDRNVEVRDLRQVVFAVDEIHDVRMIHPQNAHVRAAARAALLHHIRRGVIQLHERDGPGRYTHRRTDDVVLGAQSGERESGPAARLMHQRHRPERVVDARAAVGEGVFHREHEARRQLAERPAGVHQGGRVGHPHPGRHELEKRLGQALHRPV